MARRCEPWLCRRECRLVPLGNLSRRNSRDTAAETESGFSGVPSGVGDDQVKFCLIIRANWGQNQTLHLRSTRVVFKPDACLSRKGGK
jgi:hypothetical protein